MISRDDINRICHVERSRDISLLLLPRTRPLPGLSCFHAREAKTCTFFGGRGKACVVMPYVQESVSKAYIYVLTSAFGKAKLDVVTKKGLSPYISETILKEVEYV